MRREAPGERPHGQRRDERKQNICGMEGHFADIAHYGQQQAEEPRIEGRVRKAPQIHRIAEKNVADVTGMYRIDLRMLCARQVVNVVALDGLVEKWQADEQHHRHDDRQAGREAYGVTGSGSGSHFKIGRRAAWTSSTRLVRVEWGAVLTMAGSVR